MQNNVTSDKSLQDYLPDVIAAAKQAGDILHEFFYNGFSHQVSIKSDKSPVTQADIAANQVIVTALKKINPDIPVLSEENEIPDFDVRKQWQRYWLIDPLDGTRGFIRRIPEFCVNIALIENHVPVLGVIGVPIDKITYFAVKNAGAFSVDEKTQEKKPITTTRMHEGPLRFISGRFDQQAELNASLQKVFGEVQLTQMNSALKYPKVACGAADVYIRVGPTSEWDSAAGHCILEAAGGAVVDFQGLPLQYNAKSSLINPSFIAIGDPQLLERIINNIRNV